MQWWLRKKAFHGEDDSLASGPESLVGTEQSQVSRSVLGVCPTSALHPVAISPRFVFPPAIPLATQPSEREHEREGVANSKKS